jgi:hypothetical protein
MANQKLTEIYAAGSTPVDPGDLAYGVKDTGTTPDENAFKYSQLMFNRYKITPTVASNDLILELKHEDGTDPSANRPLYFKIGNTLRACTAALSVTKADATNWAALGSAELAAIETDLFCYLIWNTNLAPDAIDIFWSRIPHGRLYSDFSATTTNERYAAINATAPAATDECINIGRFCATLSAGAAYTFTVPTFTNLKLIHQPIFETRWLDWTPTQSGFTGTIPTSGIARYKISGDSFSFNIRNATAGTSNATTFTVTLPLTPKTLSNITWQSFISFEDNTTVSATPGRILVSSGTSTATVYSNATTGVWTNSGGKRIAGMFPLIVEL